LKIKLEGLESESYALSWN